jgi:hypothetical protein
MDPGIPVVTTHSTSISMPVTLDNDDVSRRNGEAIISAPIICDTAVGITRGVDKFFKTLAKLASSSVVLLAKSESNWPKIWERWGKKKLVRLVSGSVFLLANPKFY